MSLHELNNLMMYVHPPLAMAGYAFVFMTTFLSFSKMEKSGTLDRYLLWPGSSPSWGC